MRARATRRGNRIHLWTSIPEAGLEDRIPGAYWADRWGVWTLPLTLNHCRALREEFGSDLKVKRPLADWARGRKAEEDQMKALGATLTGVQLERVPEVYPEVSAALASRSYQSTAVRFIAEGRSVLIADTPGLGKTLESIAGILEAGDPGPYLVVAPKTSLDSVWEREILHRVSNSYVMRIRRARPARTRALEEALNPEYDLSNTWVIVNIEMIRTRSHWECRDCGKRWRVSNYPKSNVIDCECEDAAKRARTVHEHEYPQLFDVEWGAIIMDESQKSLIRTSGTPTLTRNGAMLLRSRRHPKGELRIALSGTPMRGKPHRLFGTLEWLRRKEFTGLWNWVALYWEINKGFGGSRLIGELIPGRDKWLMRDLHRIMLRRTKLEVSPELPAKAYMGERLDPKDPGSPIAVWLEMDPKQAKSYEEMLRMGSAAIEGGEMNALGGLAELTRLKQFSTSWMRVEPGSDGMNRYRATLPSNKYDWLKQFATELGIIDPDDTDPPGKVIVVSQFTDTLDLFRSALERETGISTLAITGRVTGRDRTRAQDLFNDMGSGYNVLFLNTMAGGVSITLDSADDMVFLDETHVPDDQEQAEERNNNRRPEEKIATRRYWYLKSLGTVDEAIAKVNLRQDYQQKSVLDGSRGVTYVKEVFREMQR